MWLFVNDFKYGQMIYSCKAFFIMSMNLSLLPQNKAPFGLDLLVKNFIAHKYVLTIRPLSSEIKGTMLKKSSR